MCICYNLRLILFLFGNAAGNSCEILEMLFLYSLDWFVRMYIDTTTYNQFSHQRRDMSCKVHILRFRQTFRVSHNQKYWICKQKINECCAFRITQRSCSKISKRSLSSRLVICILTPSVSSRRISKCNRHDTKYNNSVQVLIRLVFIYQVVWR